MRQLKGWKQLYTRNGARINCYYTVKTGIRKLFSISILIVFLKPFQEGINLRMNQFRKILR